MNSARVRGQRRIGQATAVLAALAVGLTGGSMAMAYADVRAAAAGSGTVAETSTTRSSDTSSNSSDSTRDSTSSDPGGSTSLGTGSGPSSARSAGS